MNWHYVFALFLTTMAIFFGLRRRRGDTLAIAILFGVAIFILPFSAKPPSSTVASRQVKLMPHDL